MPSDIRCPTCGSDDPKVRGFEVRESMMGCEPLTCRNRFHDTPPADTPRDEVMAAGVLTDVVGQRFMVVGHDPWNPEADTFVVMLSSGRCDVMTGEAVRAFIERSQP